MDLDLNGRRVAVESEPDTPLLYVLRDELGLNAAKFGCGLGQCGACTVIIKGEATRSCITPVGSIEGSAITTLDGLGTPDSPHPIQQAFIAEQALQCGFCMSGIILTAKAFLDEHPKATVAEIEEGLYGVLCRCCAHTRIVKAIQRYQKEVAQ